MLKIEVKDGIQNPGLAIAPNASTMCHSFPVTYDDGINKYTFPIYFDNSTTMKDIIDLLLSLFW